MMYLKQSTAVTLKIGPFLDSTDGDTEETGLTITQAEVRLSKNGANIAQKNEASNCTHDELGVYGCPIDATDTNTLGILQLWVHESGALSVWHEYMVMPANVYDSMFSTDKLQVDTVEISGDSTAADNAELAYDGTGFGFTNCTMPTTTAVTNQVTADVTAISGDAGAADNAESFFDGTGYAGTNNVIPTVTVTTDVTNQVTADVTAISGDAAAANNAESFFDGTGYAGTNNVIPTVTDVTNRVTANTDQIEGADATDQIRDSVVDDATRIDGSAINALSGVTNISSLVVDAAGNVAADVVEISGDATAANNLELDYDGTGYAKANSTIGTATAVTNQVTADVTAISGDAAAANNAESFFDGTGYAGTNNVIPTVTDVTNGVTLAATATSAQLVDDVWDEILSSGAHATLFSAGKRLQNVVLRGGTAISGGANYIELPGPWSATDGIYEENIISIVDGTGAAQTRLITDYIGATRIAYVDRDWDIVPDNTSEIELLPFSGILLSQHGIATAGAVGSITLTADASATSAIYVGSVVYISSGTGTGQVRLITAYDGATKIATVSDNWTTIPDNTSVYKVLPVGRTIVDSISAAAQEATADAIWDEARAGHVAVGSFGEGVASVQGNVTGAVGSVTGAVGSVTGNVGGNLVGDVQGNVDGSVASVTGAVGSVTGNVGGNVTGNVGGNVTGSVGSVAAGGIAAASFAASAIDANALATDAAQEIADTTLGRNMATVAGAASRSLLNAIRFLRNRWEIVAGTLTVYEEDDATSAWTGVVTTAVSDPVDEINPT
jgi:hypothetical protein